MFPIYPYINVNDLNLDYLLKSIKEIQTQVEYFVSLNAIKYADPIQWDITRQYEKNTIVIDPQTGTAYISVAPVPIGAQLTRPEYWTVVFDLGSFVVRASKNFAINYEADTTTTATFNTPQGGWLVWGDVLYIANVPITAGDSYVDGGNISHFTMEEIIGHLNDLLTTDKDSIVDAINELYTALNNAVNALSLIIGDLNDLTTTDKTSIVNAINELVTNIGNLAVVIGDLGNLTTSDTSSIVNAINELVTNLGTLNNTIGDLNDLITTDKTSIVNAINEVKGDFNAEDLKVGDLADLTTTDKSSIVNAINDISSIIPPAVALNYINPDDFGAVGDDVTDDTQAINDAIAECISTGKALYIPNKVYKTTSTITFPNPLNFNIYMIGQIHYTGNGLAVKISHGYNKTMYFNILGDAAYNATSVGLELDKTYNCDIYIIGIRNFNVGLKLCPDNAGVGYNTFRLNCIANYVTGILLTDVNMGWSNENLFIGGRMATDTDSPYYAYIRTGIKIDSPDTYFNGNKFIKPSLEGNSVGIDIQKGINNTFEDCRFEGVTKGCIFNNVSRENKITFTNAPSLMTNDYNHRVNYAMPSWLDKPTVKIFDSGFIPEYAFSVSNNAGYIGETLFSYDNDNKVAPYNFNKTNDYVSKLNCFVHLEKISPMFGLQANGTGDIYYALKLYDSNGAEITPTELGGNSFTFGSYTDQAINGTHVWVSNSPVHNGLYNIKVPEIVASMDVGLIISAANTLKSFSIVDYNHYKIDSSYGEYLITPYYTNHSLNRGVPDTPTCPGINGQYVMNTGADTTIRGWYYNGSWTADTF